MGKILSARFLSERSFMTKKEFMRAMKCGLGRCGLFLEKGVDIERFKPIVLYGCLNELAFDEQCEGTRGQYIFELTRYFNDNDYFAGAAAEKFLSLSVCSPIHFNHICDLLFCFADIGNQTARTAINKKYGQIYRELMKTRQSVKQSRISDNYEYICINLCSVGNEDTLLKTAEDMGGYFLRRKNDGIDDLYWEFAWFLSRNKKQYLKKEIWKKLNALAEKSENVRKFIKVLEYEKPRRSEIKKKYPETMEILRQGELYGKHLITLRASLRNDPESMATAARLALSEPDEEKKAYILRVFMSRYCVYPLDPKPIIEYARSENKELKKAAADVLTYVKDNSVRSFAIELTEQGENVLGGLEMLLTNFRAEDEELVMKLLKGLPVSYRQTDWHAAVLDIINAAHNGVKITKPLLMYVYENSLCSCCRFSAVKLMGKRRMLGKELLIECTRDCDSDIRKYASDKLKSLR